MEELLSLKWKHHSSTFINILGMIRTKQLYTDVTLACSGEFYGAHRMVLTACSSYFKDIFDHTECKKPVIVLHGISSVDLEGLLDYMYLGEVNVKQCALSSLIKAAESLQIKGLAVADDELPNQSTDPRENSSNSTDNKRKRKLNEIYNPQFIDVTPKAKALKQNEKTSPNAKTSKVIEKSSTSSVGVEEIFTKEEPTYEVDSSLVKEEIDDSLSDEPFIIKDSQEDNETGVDTSLKPENLPSQLNYYGNMLNRVPEDSSNEQDSVDASCHFQEDLSEWQGNALNYLAPDLDTEQYPGTNNIPNSKMCPYCYKDFLYESQLKRHIRRHTGEKPFFCHMCSNKYTRKEDLKKHLYNHHDITE